MNTFFKLIFVFLYNRNCHLDLDGVHDIIVAVALLHLVHPGHHVLHVAHHTGHLLPGRLAATAVRGREAGLLLLSVDLLPADSLLAPEVHSRDPVDSCRPRGNIKLPTVFCTIKL